MGSIKLNELNKFYNKGKPNELHVLKNVSLSIHSGEMVAIMGTSGSGKSTLLNILGCLDSFESGEYILQDTSVSALNEKQQSFIRCEKIGFVLQDFALINDETALENVKVPLFFDKSFKFKDIKRASLSALSSLNIEELAKKKVHQLSGGQQQRVAIARAIVNKPSILLADEPTGSLDSATSKDILGVLKNLNNQGMTIILVTHDQAVADQCDRILHIIDGKIINNDQNNPK